MSTEAELRANQTVANTLRGIIGQGVAFPVKYAQGGGIALSNAGQRIRDSIHLILSTRIGERPMNPEFGSRLYQLVFEPNDLTLKGVLRFYTAEAISRWEKRVKITDISFIDDYEDDNNTIGIRIEYVIHNTHMRGSYVYPFTLGGMPSSELYTGVEVRNFNETGTVLAG